MRNFQFAIAVTNARTIQEREQYATPYGLSQALLKEDNLLSEEEAYEIAEEAFFLSDIPDSDGWD